MYAALYILMIILFLCPTYLQYKVYISLLSFSFPKKTDLYGPYCLLWSLGFQLLWLVDSLSSNHMSHLGYYT